MTSPTSPPGGDPNAPPIDPNVQGAAGTVVAVKALEALQTAFKKADAASQVSLITTTETLQKLNIELKKSLGDEATPAFNAAVNNFRALNSATNRFNVSLKESREVQENFRGAFLFTDEYKNINEEVTFNTAKLINVFPKGQEAIRTFALQTELNLKQSRLELVRLGRAGQKAGTGLSSLVVTQKELIDTGVGFGLSAANLRKLTIDAELLGKSVGKSGKEVIGLLGKFRNVEQRVNLVSQLSTIAAMTPDAVGIPSELLETADMRKQVKGLGQTFAIFRQQFQKMNELERNKFAQAITSVFGDNNRALVQTFLQTSPDQTRLKDKAEAALAAATRPDRFTAKEIRGFTTARKALEQQIEANKIAVALAAAARKDKKAKAGEGDQRKPVENLNESFSKLGAAAGSLNGALSAADELFKALNINMTEYNKLMKNLLKAAGKRVNPAARPTPAGGR